LKLYLDTNAANYLYGRVGWSDHATRSVRRALASECESGRIDLLMSFATLEELSGLGRQDLPRFTKTIKFLLDLAGPRLLLPMNERIKAEVVARGLLNGNTRFVSSSVRRRLRAQVMGHSFVKEVSDAVRRDVDAFGADMEAKRTAIRARLGPEWSSHTARWWDSALPQIDDWTNDYLKASAEALALPADPEQWPQPRQVPTAWSSHAYYMARIALNVGQNRRINDSDRYDHAHYASAIYADLMVTDDRAFVETYTAIPDKPFVVEGFTEFAARLGVVP
jgi:hypothetical protein